MIPANAVYTGSRVRKPRASGDDPLNVILLIPQRP